MKPASDGHRYVAETDGHVVDEAADSYLLEAVAVFDPNCLADAVGTSVVEVVVHDDRRLVVAREQPTLGESEAAQMIGGPHADNTIVDAHGVGSVADLDEAGD